MSERDFTGYGRSQKRVDWPGGARLPVVFVLNLEEGAEPSIADGDGYSEVLLTDAGASPVARGTRDRAAESMFEFGSRVGFWRLARLFEERGLRLTVAACAQALQRNPEITAWLAEHPQHEVMCHGARWIEHHGLDPDRERREIAQAVAAFRACLGRPPRGWMCRYGPSTQTRALLAEHGGFLYDADDYSDELPFWTRSRGQPWLVVPHTFANNDNKFAKGWMGAADEFERWCGDALDQHLAESSWRSSVLTVSLHCRLSGQAARAAALARFLDRVVATAGVWSATREALALHWRAIEPPPGAS